MSEASDMGQSCSHQALQFVADDGKQSLKITFSFWGYVLSQRLTGREVFSDLTPM